jgi:hypothetical protein
MHKHRNAPLGALIGILFAASVSLTAADAGSGRQKDQTRIWYPPSHLPVLALPGGHHEVIRSILNVKTPMRYGDFVWSDNRVPRGNIWVRVDLAHQELSVFRGGDEIGSTVILFGGPDNATPKGIFSILEKNPTYFSRTYQAPMPYMLRLTRDGVAIHGSDVREGWATHGCIGVPLAFARLIFSVAQKGDFVAIL